MPAAALVAAIASPVGDLAGRYGRHFKIGTVDDGVVPVDDVVEVLPIDANRAYFRLRLHFHNGHICSTYGVAEAEGRELVYHKPAGQSGDHRCTLRIARAGDRLSIDAGGSCWTACGARGTLRKAGLPWSSRREITYGDRIRSSLEYREALEEFRKQQPVR